jgi:hypothetical protein
MPIDEGAKMRYAVALGLIFLGLIIGIVVGSLTETFIVVSGGAALFGLALILVAYHTPEANRGRYWRWIPLKEFGEAIAISAFLALSLDYYLRSRTIQTVVESAAAHYMVYGLPPEVADEVGYIRQLEMLRKNYRVTYRFRQIQGDPQHLVMEKEWSFTIVNYSNHPSPYTHKVVLDQDPDEPAWTRILRVTARGRDLSQSYDSASNLGSSFGRTVRIRPNGTNPENVFEAKICRVVRVKDRITDYLVNVPVLNAFVEVEKPPSLAVTVTFGDHKKPETTSPSADFETWALRGVSLPGLAIEARWFPTRPPNGSVSQVDRTMQTAVTCGLR